MRKIHSLREALAAALPELKDSPDRLKVWIEQGTARSVQTESEGLAFAFRLNVLVVELSADIAVLALAIFRWLRIEQPALLAPKAQGFSFDADLLDNDTADVLIQLDLDQNLRVTPRPEGGDTLEYLGEPDPLFDDAIPLTDPMTGLAGVDVLADFAP